MQASILISYNRKTTLPCHFILLNLEAEQNSSPSSGPMVSDSAVYKLYKTNPSDFGRRDIS